MVYEHISVAAGPVARVVLTRPEVRNAMSAVTLRELADGFRLLAKDPEVRVVLVTGSGKDFCAGADIQWMKAGGRLPPEEGKKDARLFADMLGAVESCPVPVVVAAQGSVFGGGLGLLAACDAALLSDDAKLSFSECRLGIMPAVISCWVLPKIGAANARRYYLTAEVFGAAQALGMGLVHEVVPAAELSAKADAVVASILKCGPNAVRAAKKMIPVIAAASPEARVELAVDTLAELRSSPEGQEGLAAFLDKRAPSWAAKPCSARRCGSSRSAPATACSRPAPPSRRTPRSPSSISSLLPACARSRQGRSFPRRPSPRWRIRSRCSRGSRAVPA